MIPWLAAATGNRFLLSAGRLDPRFTVSRAQVGGAQSTSIGPDGLIRYHGADVARFNGAGQRLLIEGQRTNDSLYSGDMGDAVWAAEPAATFTKVGTAPAVSPDGTSNAYQITHGAGGNFFDRYQQNVSPSVVERAFSVWIRNASGSGLAALYTNPGFGPDFAASATWFRASLVSTAAGNAQAHGISRGTTTPAVDWYLFGSQFEAGAFASSYIPTTSAALTRGRDVITAPLSAFAITGALTITGVAMIPQNAPTGVIQTILSIDDGTDNNRYTLRNPPAAATIQAIRVTGGVPVVSTNLGSMTAGTAFRYALILNGDGTGSALFEGGSWQTITGGPTGMTTLRLGSIVAAGAELFGEHTNFQATPGALSQSAAAARMTATPLT